MSNVPLVSQYLNYQGTVYETIIVYLLVCHVPFPAQGAVRILHRAGNHMTDQQIYFSD